MANAWAVGEHRRCFDVRIIRKWGSWEVWFHDSAVVTGGGRHYILVALTQHPKGDEYLVDLAKAVDDLMVLYTH